MTNHSSPRRRSAALAAAAFATGALVIAGCTPDNGDASDAASGSSDSGTQTITVWHYFSDDNQVKVMDDYKDLFEANNEGATVENVFVPYDQLNSRLITGASTETGPDVVVFNGADASTLALGDVLAPIDDYWADFADAGQFPESVVHSLDGSAYAVQGYVNLLGLWYNADILAEVGVEPPTSIDELNSALDKVVAAGYSGITLSGLPNSQGEWQGYPWMSAFGFNYDDPQVQPLTDAFSMIQNWTDSGALTAEAVTWDQTVPFQTFAAGNVAFAENGNWQMGTAAATADFEYGVVPLPVGETGQVYLGGEGEGIGAFSQNPDLAWKYLSETYFSTEGQLIAADVVGSIPARADAAQDDAVTSNALLDAFATSIDSNGANYPSPAIAPESVADQQLEVGQVWSSVIGGQLTPDAAAEQVVTALAGLK
ncbi:sugar ABC transporter substrate-binding protein [Demequina aurantiaca]|uniref:sugar ABC transporter substrate-binding protein n=1 Tax=Demequina aurantiaca TaxID=676200 RepID=UPI000A00AFE6|nr:extracellular solute-binding protein [Demequina aurantiaca]